MEKDLISSASVGESKELYLQDEGRVSNLGGTWKET